MSRLLLSLFYILFFQTAVNAQTVNECVQHIKGKGKEPKEYIFDTFKDVDVIIIGERDHRDTTQYELIIDILKDPRFAEEIGYVYTEVGVTNMTDSANKLIKGEYANHDEFYSSFLKFYRDFDYEILWEKYNGYKFIKGLYDINRTLPTDKKITWGLTDRPWIWTEATYESGTYNYYRVYQNRDKYMADNFLRLYKEQPLKNGHRKALVITNFTHALKIKKNISAPKSYVDTSQGYHISKELGKDHVKILLFNYFNPSLFNVNEKLFADGVWDAAFELTGCKPVAVSFHHSPFGKYKEKHLGKKWEKLADGLIFYLPFYQFKYVVGIPQLFGNDFIDEYQRRDSITRNQAVPLHIQDMQKWYNKTRETSRSEYEEKQKEQMQKAIRLYKEKSIQYE